MAGKISQIGGVLRIARPTNHGAADPDYLFTSVVGVDVQTTPGVAQLEVTTQGGPWGGLIWSSDWNANYLIALNEALYLALIRYKAKRNGPALSYSLTAPLTSDTPSGLYTNSKGQFGDSASSIGACA